MMGETWIKQPVVFYYKTDALFYILVQLRNAEAPMKDTICQYIFSTVKLNSWMHLKKLTNLIKLCLTITKAWAMLNMCCHATHTEPYNNKYS